jgi:hypothetical protein
MVDRAKGDPRNLLAVILSREEHGYKLGTKSGVLRGLYTRNQFELFDNNFLAILLNLQLFFQAFNTMTTKGR